MRRLSPSILAAGALFIVVTLAAYFLIDLDRGSPLNVWALSFILFSEFVTFGGIAWMKSSADEGGGLFKTVGSVTVLVLYLLTTVVSTFASRSMVDPEIGSPNGMILLQLGVIAAFAIVFIGVSSFGRRVGQRNQEDYDKISDNTPKRGGF